MTFIYKHILTLMITSSVFVSQFSLFSLSHAERLTLLKNKGFNPEVIYDIGAYRGEWATEIQQVFKHAQFFLFEANEYHKPYLQQLAFPYFFSLLGDAEKSVPFYSTNTTGDSIFQEQTNHYKDGSFNTKTVQMTTLDKIVKKNNLPLPNLIKMDVQGAEKIIIQGSTSIICYAEVIIIEVGVLEYNKNAPLIFEMMALMHELGYITLDFVELHYLPTKELFEADILFVKSTSSLIKKGVLG